MKTKKPIRPRGIGPLPVPPKRKKTRAAPADSPIYSLECSICGEPLAGERGDGLVYQTKQRDHICQYCLAAADDLLCILNIAQDSQRYHAIMEPLIRLLSRTGHKARVRVRQHEERKHERFVQDPALTPDPRS